jgi:hypothetical protein
VRSENRNHRIAHGLHARTVAEEHRAHTKINDETRPTLTHFVRNRNIVNESDVLIAVPMQAEHQDRGGTWYTYDYATKQLYQPRGIGRVILIRPDGTWEDSWSVR